ncbi:DeoR/GlpR family DNA-binding transcription regulator [Rhizobium sp. BK060]|uniref:DeoR/GlpR family DNA-binding transcription regulator n=1 Tax=Rhizobium sp. BK060 TaxID=2587096 RepID=UPI0016189358|nr:DeoR/GlpR family DNA-binding transcription regulator [Rhizobium sp. BK060]MBB3395996.1 DeoR/GlpR family transcriptional regulator of sugar metabolism [Rhizobium sp. BK060]
MRTLFPNQRRAVIEGRLKSGNAVIAAELAAELETSEDAIRRDLRQLAAAGVCTRVYGGAVPVTPAFKSFDQRNLVQGVAKSALAKSAARLIRPAELVFLDSSSTNLRMIEYIDPGVRVTFATNSIPIAAALYSKSLTLLQIGGLVDLDVGGSVDAGAVASIENMNIDRCFLGVCSVSAKTGISVDRQDDAIFKRTLIKRSLLKIVLVLSDKLDMHAPFRVADATDIDLVIAEEDIPDARKNDLIKAGYSVQLAG